MTWPKFSWLNPWFFCWSNPSWSGRDPSLSGMAQCLGFDPRILENSNHDSSGGWCFWHQFMVGMLEPPHYSYPTWLCQTVCYWTWPSRNSGFSHEKWWFSMVMLVYQVTRGYIIVIYVYIPYVCIPKWVFQNICPTFWLVVYLPLWKMWLRQLGWWHSQLNGKS